MTVPPVLQWPLSYRTDPTHPESSVAHDKAETAAAHVGSESYLTTGSTMCDGIADDAYTRCVAFT